MPNNILKQYNIQSDAKPYGDGHINSTYICPPYILQKINTEVFKNPVELMENVENVTEHIKKKLKAAGRDESRETLTIVKTTQGKNFCQSGDEYFRVYKFIDNAYTMNSPKNPEMLESAAAAIGDFQSMLADFPAETLHETIVDFHNTPARIAQLKSAIDKNLSGRLSEVSPEVDFALLRADSMALVVDGIADGSVPLRVSHNDTKLNNIMFDNDTDKGICVIDLDTVMPGSFLYDYGDFLRFAASTAPEDEKDLSKVHFDMDVFRTFTKGYLSAAGKTLTENEIELMPYSIRLMTYECGIRFLADHINGDIYFGKHYEGQNLDRARTQFKLVSEIESKTEEMKEYIKSIIG